MHHLHVSVFSRPDRESTVCKPFAGGQLQQATAVHYFWEPSAHHIASQVVQRWTTSHELATVGSCNHQRLLEYSTLRNSVVRALGAPLELLVFSHAGPASTTTRAPITRCT